jgi:hypothetical protein
LDPLKDAVMMVSVNQKAVVELTEQLFPIGGTRPVGWFESDEEDWD